MSDVVLMKGPAEQAVVVKPTADGLIVRTFAGSFSAPVDHLFPWKELRDLRGWRESGMVRGRGLARYYRNIRLRVVLGLRVEGWTFRKIAKLLGVSRERVRQLNFRAERLRATERENAEREDAECLRELEEHPELIGEMAAGDAL